MEPIEESYFNWLCAKVLYKVHGYLDLMKALHGYEFVWVVGGDENRLEEGVRLRGEFLAETGLSEDIPWAQTPCSVLEMLIAFSKRVAFLTSLPAQDWFWTFITNLGLEDFRNVDDEAWETIQNTLYIFVWRTYPPNGDGGLFPMQDPSRDQSQVELWYQFSEYLHQQGLV